MVKKHPTRLLLVRHGATAWNDEHRIIGRSDLPLSANGMEQAKQLANKLSMESIDTILSSDLKRAAETAEIIAEPGGHAVGYDARLRELDFGLWEGLTVRQVEAESAGAFERWKENANLSPPSGESPPAIIDRVQAFIAALREMYLGETILIVSHGVILQVMVYSLLNIPFRNDWTFYMYNGSITEMRITSNRTVMVYLNDTSHLTTQEG